MTRLCILAAALAVIARTRVAGLPGWGVPLPVRILAALLTVSAAAVTWLVVRLYREGGPRTVLAWDLP